MTEKSVEVLFFTHLEEKAIYNKLEGISEDKIYNWRKGRGRKPTFGEMLEVLWQLGKIEIKYSPTIYVVPDHIIKNLTAEIVDEITQEKNEPNKIP